MRPSHLCAAAAALAIVSACTTVHAAPVHYKSLVVSKSGSDHQYLDVLASRGLKPDIIEELDGVIQAASKPDAPSTSVSAPVQYSAPQRAAHVWVRPASGEETSKPAQSTVTTSAHPRLPLPVFQARPWSAPTAQNVWTPARPLSRVWVRPQQAERPAAKQDEVTLKRLNSEPSAKASTPHLPAATSSDAFHHNSRHLEASTSQPERKRPRPDDLRDERSRALNNDSRDATQSSSSEPASKTPRLGASSTESRSRLAGRLQPPLEQQTETHEPIPRLAGRLQLPPPDQMHQSSSRLAGRLQLPLEQQHQSRLEGRIKQPLEQQSSQSSSRLAGRLQLPFETQKPSRLAGRLELPPLESHSGEAATEVTSDVWSRLSSAEAAKDKARSRKRILDGMEPQERALKEPKLDDLKMPPIPGGRLGGYDQMPIPPTTTSSVAPFPYTRVDLSEVPAHRHYARVPKRTYRKEHIELAARTAVNLFSAGKQIGVPHITQSGMINKVHWKKGFPHELSKYPDSPAIFPSEHETKEGQASELELKEQVMTFPIRPSHSPEGTRLPDWNGKKKKNSRPGHDRVILTKNQDQDTWQIVTCIAHSATEDGKRCFVQGTRGSHVG